MLGLGESSERVESEPIAKRHEEREQGNNLGRVVCGTSQKQQGSPREQHFVLRDDNRIRDPVEGQLWDKRLRSASEHIC